MTRRLLAIASLLLLMGCSAKKPLHPGAVSNVDSYSYDVLLISQTIIGQARADYLAQNLPASSKDVLNKAIDSYNVAESSWQSYHAGTSKDSTALEQAIQALSGAVAALVQLKTNAPPAPAKPVGKLEYICPVGGYCHGYWGGAL